MGGHKKELTNINNYALLSGRIGRELAPSSMKNSSKCIINGTSCRNLIQQNQIQARKRARSLPPDALTNSMILIVVMKNNKQTKMLSQLPKLA